MVNLKLCEIYHSLKTHARKKNSAFNDQICTKKFFFQASFLPFFPFIGNIFDGYQQFLGV